MHGQQTIEIMWSHETDSQRRKIKACNKLTGILQKQLQKNPEHTASRRYHRSVRSRSSLYYTLHCPRILGHVVLFHQVGISRYLHGPSCAKSLTIFRGRKKQRKKKQNTCSFICHRIWKRIAVFTSPSSPEYSTCNLHTIYYVTYTVHILTTKI